MPLMQATQAPAPPTQMNTAANQSAAGQGGQASVKAVSFLGSTRQHTEVGQSTVVTLSAATQQVPIQVPINGYLDVLFILVTAVVPSTNSATVVFAGDAPWNFFQSVFFKDANSNPFWNLSGYSAFLAAKYGAYRLFPIDGSANFYSTTAGSGATGGNFQFILPIWVGFAREGTGLLPNMDATTQLRVDLTINTSANVYSTAPTALPNVTIQPIIMTFQTPPAQDAMGQVLTTEPPGRGSYQLWTSTSYALNSGENTILLNSATGNSIRSQILIFRNGSTGGRAPTYLPTSNLTYEVDATIMWLEPVAVRNFLTWTAYGFDPPSGCLIYNRTMDPDNVLIGEFGEMYLKTFSGTKLLLRFTPGAAPAAGSTIEVLTNHVVRAELIQQAYAQLYN